jgi:hypothetical protein
MLIGAKGDVLRHKNQGGDTENNLSAWKGFIHPDQETISG